MTDLAGIQAAVAGSARELIASVVGRHESGLNADELRGLEDETRRLAETGASLIR